MSPLVSQPRPRERSHRPALRLTGARRSDAPREIVPGRSSLTVLVAGADAYRRAILRAELASTLPRMTRFCEAEEVAQVLEHAADSRLVVLAGDLQDAEAESLMRLLGQRHPQLPVVSLDDEPAHASARAQAEVRD
jgi:DNA-binding NtrC family response regulator